VLRQRLQEEERECERLLREDCVLPAYDCVLRISHWFNLLDARGVLSVGERTHMIGRVRAQAASVARKYLELQGVPA
ncbi:MAG: glycine--tRNA ligase subunit alpha, partial [Elusimicrobia bacterium]|nr:glycine--tRNA ligase subunit alpha [Elusimicrobiota bacterium]